MNKFAGKTIWQIVKSAAKEGMAEGRSRVHTEAEARRAARARARRIEKARRNLD